MHIIYGLMNRWIIEPVEIGTPQNIHELLNWDEQGGRKHTSTDVPSLKVTLFSSILEMSEWTMMCFLWRWFSKTGLTVGCV